MRKTIFTLLALFCLTAAAFAQGQMEFEDKMHDFGELKEGEPAEHVFTFVNTGDAPVVISHVKASCGCTTPEWPREPILPGETGKIKAVYNSKGRLGSFNKSVTVNNNTSQAAIRLYIKGNVTRDAEHYGSLGQIALREASYDFGEVPVGGKVSHAFAFTNNGKGPVAIKEVLPSCDCLTYTVDKKTLQPGESGKLVVTYQPTKASDRYEAVRLLTDSQFQKEASIKLKVKAVDEGRSPVLQDQASSPFGG